MIKKFDYYITEKNKSIKYLLLNLDIDTELNNEIKKCQFTISYNHNRFFIEAKDRSILDIIIIREDYLKLESIYSPEIFKIDKNDYKNIKTILKEKILVAFIICLLDLRFNEICFVLHISLKDNIDDIVNKLIKNNKIDFFMNLMKEKYLPDYIIEKYSYLINSSKFDLI